MSAAQRCEFSSLVARNRCCKTFSAPMAQIGTCDISELRSAGQPRRLSLRYFDRETELRRPGPAFPRNADPLKHQNPAIVPVAKIRPSAPFHHEPPSTCARSQWVSGHTTRPYIPARTSTATSTRKTATAPAEILSKISMPQSCSLLAGRFRVGLAGGIVFPSIRLSGFLPRLQVTMGTLPL
jgi:hypothetical protein